MKILRVIASMNPADGGVVEAVNQAVQNFNNGRHSMEVLCLDADDEPWITANQCYKLHAIGGGCSAYNFHFSYFSWLKCNAKNYDVIIIDGLWQFLVAGGYLLKAMGVPYFVFAHGMLARYFNDDVKKYIKKLPFWFLIERNVLQLANGVIFTCEEEKLSAVDSFPLAIFSSYIATLGVAQGGGDPEQLKKALFYSYPELSGKRVVLFLGRIGKIKGIDMLIDALEKMESMPSDYVLAIAGPDNEGLKNQLQLKAKNLDVDRKIFWLGMLEGDIKWGAYQAAECFILPSHHENFGIVVAEALSTSTPVLITDKVNVWREIDEADAGLVANDDVDGVKQLLNSWFDMNDSEKASMRDAAYTCYVDNFSIDKAAKDLELILSGVSRK